MTIDIDVAMMKVEQFAERTLIDAESKLIASMRARGVDQDQIDAAIEIGRAMWDESIDTILDNAREWLASVAAPGPTATHH